MRRLLLLLLVLPAVFLPSAAEPRAAAVGNCTPGSWGSVNTDFASQVVTLVNQHRQGMGLAALNVSPTLTASARWKSLHMAYYGYFDHYDENYPSPGEKRSPWDRFAACGYTYNTYLGENIAYGQTTPAQVMNDWLNSQGHRENIENPSFAVIGVGVASSGGGQLYWTQDFGGYDDSNDEMVWKTRGGTHVGNRGLGGRLFDRTDGPHRRRGLRDDLQFGKSHDRRDRERRCCRRRGGGRGGCPPGWWKRFRLRLDHLLEVLQHVEVEAAALRFSATPVVRSGRFRSHRWRGRLVTKGRRHGRPDRRGLGHRRCRRGRTAARWSEGRVRKRGSARWTEETWGRWRNGRGRRWPRLLLWHRRLRLVERCRTW